MRISLNTYVDFLGDFPLPKSPSLDDVPGAETARFLAGGLKQRRIEILAIEGKGPDIGHYITCVSKGRRFQICVTVDQWQDVGRWQLLTSVLNQKGHADRLRVQGDLDALTHLLLMVNETLHESDVIRDIRWFPHFEVWEYLDVHEPGDSPIRNPVADARQPFVLRFERAFETLSSQLASPLGCILLFVGAIAVSFIDRNYGMIFAMAWVGIALFGGIVVPMFTSRYISYLARRRNKQRQPE